MGKLEDVPSGPATAAEQTAAESHELVTAARALLLGMKAVGVESYQAGLILCSAIVMVCDAQRDKRAALGLCINFLQERLNEDYPAKPEQQS